MKYITFVTISLVALLGFARHADAALMGVIRPEDAMSNAKNIQAELFDLTNGTYTDLKTTIAKLGGSASRYKDTVYFSNGQGLFKQKIGAFQPTRLRQQGYLTAFGLAGKWWVIANEASKGNRNSFLVDVTSKAIKPFSPAIHDVVTISVSADSKRLLIVAHNTQGKQKLFLSTGNLWTLREISLPAGATACAFADLNTNATAGIADCTYPTAKNKSRHGLVAFTVAGNTITAGKPSITTATIQSEDWTDPTHWVDIETSAKNVTTVQSRTVSRRTFGKPQQIVRQYTTTISGVDYASIPMQVRRLTADKFYIVMLYGTATDIVGTNVYYYDLDIKELVALIANDRLQLFL